MNTVTALQRYINALLATISKSAMDDLQRAALTEIDQRLRLLEGAMEADAAAPIPGISRDDMRLDLALVLGLPPQTRWLVLLEAVRGDHAKQGHWLDGRCPERFARALVDVSKAIGVGHCLVAAGALAALVKDLLRHYGEMKQAQ